MADRVPEAGKDGRAGGAVDPEALDIPAALDGVVAERVVQLPGVFGPDVLEVLEVLVEGEETSSHQSHWVAIAVAPHGEHDILQLAPNAQVLKNPGCCVSPLPHYPGRELTITFLLHQWRRNNFLR